MRRPCPVERRPRSDGFTLVEILIVVVILGLLAAIVVIAVGSSTTSASNKACASEVQTFYTAVQSYNADQASKPIPAPLTGDGTGMTTLWTGASPLLQRAPTNEIAYPAGAWDPVANATKFAFDTTRTPQLVQGNSCK